MHVIGSIHASYGVVGIILVLAVGLGVLALVPRRRRPAAASPPEFGGAAGHKAWVQFRLRYAVVALLFVAFDMEMVFMFPWAVAFHQMGLIALADMFVFIAILTSAIVFAWKAGAFDWEG